MEWENKTKLVQLGNAMNNSDGSKTEFQNYCLEQMPNFDGQAWDMFCNLIEIIPAEMKADLEFWRKVWQCLKDVDCNDEKFGLISGMRIALIQTICENELKLGN